MLVLLVYVPALAPACVSVCVIGCKAAVTPDEGRGILLCAGQVVVAVMLESFFSARQQYREEEALTAAVQARHGAALHASAANADGAAERPFDQLLQEVEIMNPCMRHVLTFSCS